MQKAHEYKSKFNGDAIVLPLTTVQLLTKEHLDNLIFVQAIEIEGDEPKARISKSAVKSDDTNNDKA